MGKYIYWIFVVVFFSLLANEAYKYFYPNDNIRAKRIECQEESITFERIYSPSLIKEAINALESGNVKTKYKMVPSVYTTSQMGKYFTIEDVNNDLLKILAKHKKQNKLNTQPLLIDYYVYENDVDDPGKKTEEAKKYAGYIRMNFYIGDSHVYANQIDFMDWQGKDIKDRLECAINSLRTLENEYDKPSK
ncbi:conserved hypothetical protein [sediment metagenome]|uniref:Uncharacterized protein n=1 Tax=sediment metagenome TaxID=749907 RepID=D9PHI5_9ZZZZ